MKQVAVAAQETKLDETIKGVREGMCKLRRNAEFLGDPELKIRLTERSHANYVRQLRSIKAKIDSKFEQLEENADRYKQHYMDIFKMDRLLSRDISDKLAELENVLEPSPEKAKHFICVKQAKEWTAENNKKLLSIGDNEMKGFFQSVSKESAHDILKLVTKAEALNMSGLQVHSTVRIKKDKYRCQIVGICQIENGNIVLADNANKCLKQLDNTYTVINDLGLQGTPQDICAAGGIDVAIATEQTNVLIVAVGAEIKVMRSITMNHPCSNVVYHRGNVCVVTLEPFNAGNFRRWIKYRAAVHIYSKQHGTAFPVFDIPNDGFHTDRVRVANDVKGQRIFIGCSNTVISIDSINGKQVTESQGSFSLSGLCCDDMGCVYRIQTTPSMSIIKLQRRETNYLEEVKTITLPFDNALETGPICYDRNIEGIVTCPEKSDYVYLVHA